MHSFAWWPTVAVLIVATITDLRSRRIPNWLVLPFLAVGLGVSAWMHGWQGLGKSAEGMALGLVVFGVLHLMGGMGAGDVKLCAAIGAWVGPGQLMLALVATGIVGGILAIAWAIWGGFLGEMLKGSGDLMFGWRKRGTLSHPELTLENPKARKMPYAPAIAIGTLLSFFAH
ncbi:MAG TPA: A24 family peptidase [Terracidiphilus sp.]|nr:A24 family peptidase [Terracidiphilus sp.]